ncbi:unnamed protein product, partial [Ascophyllum nodosum]
GAKLGRKTPNLKATPALKIALFVEPTPFNYISGYSNRFREMLKFLSKAGDDVQILTTDDKKDAPDMHLNFPIITTAGFRFPLYKHIVLTFDFERKGLALLDRMKPDLMHVTSPGFLAIPSVFYARRFRVPLVISYHTHLPLYARSYLGWIPGIEALSWAALRAVHNKADLTLCTSPQMEGQLKEAGIERVGVWRKGVDVETFNPKYRDEEMRSKLTDGNPKDPLIIYVGRMGSEKRLRDLRGVLGRLPMVRLALVGTGPDADALKDYFKGTKTVLTGIMTGEALSQAFASADVFVMPSDSETLGFVVLESMASGVPVVGADAGGIPDLIDHGKTGFLVPPGDEEAMTDHVKKLLDDKALRRTISAAGRAETEKWSWEAATSVLRNVQYQKAILNFKSRGVDGLAQPRSRSRLRAVTAQFRRTLVTTKGAILLPFLLLRRQFSRSQAAPVEENT